MDFINAPTLQRSNAPTLLPEPQDDENEALWKIQHNDGTFERRSSPPPRACVRARVPHHLSRMKHSYSK